MIDTKQFLSALNQIANEKSISKERVIKTIEMAIAAAYKKDYGERGQIIRAQLDPEQGIVQMYQIKIVVDESMLKTPEEIAAEQQMRLEAKEKGRGAYERKEEEEGDRKIIFHPERHIMLADARVINPDAKCEDEMMFLLETRNDFGRIAAQTAKQVIIQRLREAERDTVFSEYQAKEGELVTAQVQQLEWKNVIFDLGKASGIMYPEEQVFSEKYRIGMKMKVYIIRAEMTHTGPMVVVSRSHPLLLKKLFEIEVPEILSGVVQIKSIAREAGSRSKVAVYTAEDHIDPIGSCVGQKGTRIGAVISELNGEKVDIIEWAEDPAQFISHALSPATVVSLTIDPLSKEAKVMVPVDQLSLAIGKGGQNVRLAVRLTGWKIDVRSAESSKEESTKPSEENKKEEIQDDQSPITKSSETIDMTS